MAEHPYQRVRFRNWALDNVNWTDIYPSGLCESVEVVNKGTDIIYIRTDADSSNTEVELYPGDRLTFTAKQAPEIPIVYAKTAGTTGPLLVEEFRK